LWARAGKPYCPRCEQPIGSQTVDQIVDRVMQMEAGSPIIILAPVRPDDDETYAALFNRLKASGYARVRIDGQISRTVESTTLDRRRKHRVEVVIDRTVVKPASRGRIAESVEHALTLGDGLMTLVAESVERAVGGDDSKSVRTRKTREKEFLFSQALACMKCGAGYEQLSPHHFSFNSQMGWCETCEGLGVQRGAPEAEIIADPSKSLLKGAISGWETISRRSPFGRILVRLCDELAVEPDTPLGEWTVAQKRVLMFGSEHRWLDGAGFTGVRFQWRGFFPAIDAATRNSWVLRHRLRNVVTDVPCITCRGGRLRSDAAAVRVGHKTIVDVCEMPLAEAATFFTKLRLGGGRKQIATELLHEIRNRLRFLVDVGLEYVTLHRAAPTLSGGEAQRIRLAGQIGSGLSGVLYVLDEPTIGLHPRDTHRLVDAIRRLRELGNTVLMVEHDRDVIRGADHLLDFGPHAGADGGEIVAQGAPSEIARRPRNKDDERSLTRQYLGGQRAIAVPTNRRPIRADWELAGERMARDGKTPRKSRPGRPWPVTAPAPNEPTRDWLIVRGARQNNLRQIDVPMPLGRLVCVTGVSGSGKSSLVNDILHPALAGKLQNGGATPGAHGDILGIGALDKVIMSDQSPIGTSPSSNPATYTGAFDWIRELFARLPDSKVRGYDAGRFSFNRTGGRCDACEGLGQSRIEMHFMPDVWIECEVCKGRRYNPETLEVRFKGRSIADVLDLRVGEALQLFENVPKVRRMLQTLSDVGLDYILLGQSAPTLSGGEAQRVKLAGELGKPDTGRTLYMLDEPTTGLHFEDIRKLLEVLHRLVDLGNTVVVVEHNLDVIKNADWVIDLGPEAGEGGGRIVAMGTPEQIALVGAANPKRERGVAAGRKSVQREPASASTSHTGAALGPVLLDGPFEQRTRFDPTAHAEARIKAERAGFGDVGKDVRMPWQIDGRQWHLVQRSDRCDKPRQWEPAALEYVVEQVEKIDGFEPTNWNNRASIEVTAAGAPTWFMHALTGGEWLLELYFRTPKGHYAWRKLNDALGLKTLDERDDLPTYGDWARVDVRARQDGFDAVVVYVHDKKEIDTPAFRRLVRDLAEVYQSEIMGATRKRARAKRRRKR
jgi:excinuclease ABC subunit A